MSIWKKGFRIRESGFRTGKVACVGCQVGANLCVHPMIGAIHESPTWLEGRGPYGPL